MNLAESSRLGPGTDEDSCSIGEPNPSCWHTAKTGCRDSSARSLHLNMFLLVAGASGEIAERSSGHSAMGDRWRCWIHLEPRPISLMGVSEIEWKFNKAPLKKFSAAVLNFHWVSGDSDWFKFRVWWLKSIVSWRRDESSSKLATLWGRWGPWKARARPNSLYSAVELNGTFGQMCDIPERSESQLWPRLWLQGSEQGLPREWPIAAGGALPYPQSNPDCL